MPRPPPTTGSPSQPLATLPPTPLLRAVTSNDVRLLKAHIKRLEIRHHLMQQELQSAHDTIASKTKENELLKQLMEEIGGGSVDVVSDESDESDSIAQDVLVQPEPTALNAPDEPVEQDEPSEQDGPSERDGPSEPSERGELSEHDKPAEKYEAVKQAEEKPVEQAEEKPVEQKEEEKSAEIEEEEELAEKEEELAEKEKELAEKEKESSEQAEEKPVEQEDSTEKEEDDESTGKEEEPNEKEEEPVEKEQESPVEQEQEGLVEQAESVGQDGLSEPSLQSDRSEKRRMLNSPEVGAMRKRIHLDDDISDEESSPITAEEQPDAAADTTPQNTSDTYFDARSAISEESSRRSRVQPYIDPEDPITLEEYDDDSDSTISTIIGIAPNEKSPSVSDEDDKASTCAETGTDPPSDGYSDDSFDQALERLLPGDWEKRRRDAENAERARRRAESPDIDNASIRLGVIEDVAESSPHEHVQSPEPEPARVLDPIAQKKLDESMLKYMRGFAQVKPSMTLEIDGMEEQSEASQSDDEVEISIAELLSKATERAPTPAPSQSSQSSQDSEEEDLAPSAKIDVHEVRPADSDVEMPASVAAARKRNYDVLQVRPSRSPKKDSEPDTPLEQVVPKISTPATLLKIEPTKLVKNPEKATSQKDVSPTVAQPRDTDAIVEHTSVRQQKKQTLAIPSKLVKLNLPPSAMFPEANFPKPGSYLASSVVEQPKYEEIREVRLARLPSDITYKNLLSGVVDVGVVDSVIINWKSLEAKIIFVEPSAARNFFKGIEAGGFMVPTGNKEKKCPVLPFVYTDDSAPLTERLRRGIFENNCTRVLWIQAPAANLTETKLKADFMSKLKTPERDVYESVTIDNETAEVRFTAVKHVLHAVKTLKDANDYGQIKMKYGPDPCGQLAGKKVTGPSFKYAFTPVEKKKPASEGIKPSAPVSKPDTPVRKPDIPIKEFKGISTSEQLAKPKVAVDRTSTRGRPIGRSESVAPPPPASRAVRPVTASTRQKDIRTVPVTRPITKPSILLAPKEASYASAVKSNLPKSAPPPVAAPTSSKVSTPTYPKKEEDSNKPDYNHWDVAMPKKVLAAPAGAHWAWREKAAASQYQNTIKSKGFDRDDIVGDEASANRRKRQIELEYASRCVCVTNFPLNTTLGQMLRFVRGGPIDTAAVIGPREGFKNFSALVVFLHAQSAGDYKTFLGSNSVSFDKSHILGTTNDLPSLDNLRLWDSEKARRRGVTRCIFIEGLPFGSTVASLTRDLEEAMHGSVLDTEYIAVKGVCAKIWFSSISMALWASKALGQNPKYLGIRMRYEWDPCRGSLADIGKPPLEALQFE